MNDYEKMKPERFLIDVVNFRCDDWEKRKEIYCYLYDKGYRQMGETNIQFSYNMYRIIKKVQSNVFKSIISCLMSKFKKIHM